MVNLSKLSTQNWYITINYTSDFIRFYQFHFLYLISVLEFTLRLHILSSCPLSLLWSSIFPPSLFFMNFTVLNRAGHMFIEFISICICLIFFSWLDGGYDFLGESSFLPHCNHGGDKAYYQHALTGVIYPWLPDQGIVSQVSPL